MREVKDEKTCRGRVAVVAVSSSPRKLTSGFFFGGITMRRKYVEYSAFSVVFFWQCGCRHGSGFS